MKKWIYISLAIVLVLLIALSVFLLIRFFSLASEENSEKSDYDTGKIEAYAREHWPQYEAEFLEETLCLRLSKTASLSYEDACRIGGAVYSDSTAPETYLDAVAAIALSLRSEFGSGIQVKLVFLSTDGQEIFTVSSRGDIVTCWE